MADLFQGTMSFAFNAANQQWVSGTDYYFVDGSVAQIVTWNGITYVQVAPNTDPNTSPDALPAVWNPISPNVDGTKGMQISSGLLATKVDGTSIIYNGSGQLQAVGGGGGITQLDGSTDSVQWFAGGLGITWALLPNTPVVGQSTHQAVLNASNAYFGFSSGQLTITNNNLVSFGGLSLAGQAGNVVTVNNTNDGFILTPSIATQGGYLSATSVGGSAGTILPNTVWQNLYTNTSLVTNNFTISSSTVLLKAGKIYNIDLEGTIVAAGVVTNSVTYYFNVIQGFGSTPTAIYPQNFVVQVTSENYTSPLTIPGFSIQLPPFAEDTAVYLGYQTDLMGGQYPAVNLRGLTFRIAEVTTDSGTPGGSGLQTLNGSSNINPTFATGTNVVATTDIPSGVTSFVINQLNADIVQIANPVPMVNADNAVTAHLYLYYGGGNPNAIPYADYAVPTIPQAEVNILFGFVLYDVASGHSIPYPNYPAVYTAKFPSIPRLWLSIGGLNSSEANPFPWNSQTPAAFAADMIAYLNAFPNIVGIDYDVEGSETNNPNVLTWVPQASALIQAAKPNCKFGLVLTDQLSAGGGAYYGFYPNQKTLIANLVAAIGLNAVSMISKMTFDWGAAPIAETQCNTNSPTCQNSCVQGSIDASINELIPLLSIDRVQARNLMCAIMMVGKQNGQPADGVDDTGNLITQPWLEQQIANFQDQGMPNYGYWCINADQLATFTYLNVIYAGIQGDVPPSELDVQDWYTNTYAQARQFPITNAGSQVFSIDWSTVSNDISYGIGVTPASTFNLTLNIADLSVTTYGVTQTIGISNNTVTTINQFIITLASQTTSVIYNTTATFENVIPATAITLTLRWTGNKDQNGKNIIIASWAAGNAGQVVDVTSIVSNDNSVLITAIGSGPIDSITSSDNSINLSSTGSGDVTVITSTDNSFIVQYL